jgi:hypothetical protein
VSVLRTLTALAVVAAAASARASAPVADPAVASTAAATDPSTLERPGAAAVPAPRPGYVPPRSNETMEFQVTYLGITMGKVRIFSGQVDDATAPIFLQAQTSSIAAIVTLKQQLSSHIDVATGLPRTGSLDAVEGSYKHTDTVQFDRAASKAKVREKGKYDNTYLIDVPADATDFMALVYRLRTLPLDDGTKWDFPVLTGRTLHHCVATVLGREKVETKAGTFQAIKIRVPTGFTGKFSEKDPTFLWLSDDDRRIVVRLTADFAIGHATANLTSYSPGTAPEPKPSAVAAP